MIKDNIQRLRQEIFSVCRHIGRKPEKITLVAVTKTASLDQIREAVDCGITDIAENRIQEAKEKYPLLKDSPDLRFHLVGHLQTNKIKPALELFDLIHSVDSLRLAQQIEVAAAKSNQAVEALIEVNVSGEETKFGIKPEEAADLLASIGKLKYLRVKGLMTIAPLAGSPDQIRSCFRNLRLLKEKVEKQISLPNVEMKYLSMGMTDDYRVALEEGSNMLRIGRAIFEG
jgi:PLP dependent protein